MASNIQVGSTVTLNTARLDQLDNAQMIALAKTADALLTDVRDNGYMPFDTGNLQNDSTFVDDSNKSSGRVSIISSTPYARRLYFHPEYNFRKGSNSKAGGKWWEPYISGSDSGKAREFYRAIFKKQGGL